MLQTINLWIPGTCVPKARPRVTRNGTYFPRSYMQWRKRASGEVILQVANCEDLPIKRAEVHVVLIGQLKGDLDNVLGACLDLLVSAKVLLDDRISCIPELSIKCSSGKLKGAKITVIPLP